MNILVANIGTSDLAVKPKGMDYYFPLGFNRQEPNLIVSGLTPDELNLWENRDFHIANEICAEFNVPCQGDPPKFSFRDLTEKIYAHYQQHPNFIDRLCPGRIGGVFQEAKDKHGVKDVYLFVTNQKSKHSGDSLFLFDILKLWVEQKNWGLTLHPLLIPEHLHIIDEDLMVAEYYKFFRKLPPCDQLLVSIKGGTNQMQTALKLQTISAAVPQHL
ncbi:MAG: hypothetical protein ACRCU2_25580, partial [Planktothrix sp.]